jgi:aryl-alcohol dehydrogenase-like predicted oxidoreductase
MLPYFPLASGLLTGKYEHGVEATEGRRDASRMLAHFAELTRG